VARSHLLVLWSRLGPYDPRHLDTLLWEERALFEYWGHAAAIVLTEDYPVHAEWMRHYREGDHAWFNRVRAWMETNAGLRESILAALRARGPLLARDLEDTAVEPWRSSGWTNNRNVDRMLNFLWERGDVMVAGRRGGQKLWDVSARVLPDWTPREPLSGRDVVYRAAQKSLRALGVAQPRHIEQHYIRGRYPGLTETLADLVADGKIMPVEIRDGGTAWPGPWYIHTDDLPLLASLAADGWQPRTTLLSPFDNLICDRDRTELMWNFRFRLEIYVPAHKREYGFFVLPILRGDRLIGRVDPRLDRKRQTLVVNAVHAEPDAPQDEATGQAVREAIESLAEFVGARSITYPSSSPWTLPNA
ncbi:MAG: YcaQ family DNA glycosylase, partial [Anaerolineae bacterium]|nr:YcaQ family DNA glycosylase [Anaerolineae bacterium]